MKKVLYRLSLLLVVVSLVHPAMAAAEPARAAPSPDRGFLAFLNALQNPVPMAAAAKGKGPGGGVSQMSLCTASASCGSEPGLYCEDDTNPANCVGVDQNCPQQGYVTCDGVTTWCPNACPTCPGDWCTRDYQCYLSCYPCAPIYTCYDYPSCSDYCDCQWSTCPP